MNTSPSTDEFRSRLPFELRRLAAEHDVPGASVAVLMEDQVVEATTGVINTRTGEPVTPDTLFMIQSITKTLTATLIMQLVDEGVVAVDDLVIDHLPGFRTADSEASSKITVRHLLTHTGGFEGDLWTATTSGTEALQRFVDDLVSEAPQISAPGEQFSYCNAGYGTLGRLVEVRRAMTYEQALRRFVLRPLG
ncbi:MAG: serine hydrolase domain-containing protein, partial [Propionibacteriaceae bacterium]